MRAADLLRAVLILSLTFSFPVSAQEKGVKGGDGQTTGGTGVYIPPKGGNARNSGSSASQATTMLGGLGVLGGGYLMSQNCPNWTSVAWCLTGGAILAGGVAAMIFGGKQKGSSDPLTDVPVGGGDCPPELGGLCNTNNTTSSGSGPGGENGTTVTGDYAAGGDGTGTDPSGGDSSNGSGSGSPGGDTGGLGSTMPTLPIEIQDMIDRNRDNLKQIGINPDDPKSFQAYYDANKDKAGGGGGDIGSIAGGLSPEAQEEMKEALKKFSDKYKVSGVGLEGGGGGGGRWPGSGGKDDIADMLKNAFGNKGGDRAPAGSGLTTLFNGQVVGAASDDIFRMITSRYQVKRQEKTFLIDTATSRKPSSKRRY